MNNQTKITEAKLTLIKKIIDAKLTKAEFQALIGKAENIIKSREVV